MAGLDVAGRVYPLPYLPESTRIIVTTGARLFPNGVSSVGTRARFTGGHMSEYIHLLVRHLRSSKVALSTTALSNGTVFAVNKPNGKQREVWHRGVMSEHAIMPPKPPLQITPSSLVHLETVADTLFYVSKNDRTSFFDLLFLPLDLSKYMGRPRVKLHELLEIGGMTAEEVYAPARRTRYLENGFYPCESDLGDGLRLVVLFGSVGYGRLLYERRFKLQ